MAIAGDTFVEGSDVDLSAHTPTGANAGTSWDVLISGGNIDVIAASDNAHDAASNNGNRYRMTNDLGFDEMDVQADVAFISAGALTFPGVVGRVPNSGTGTAGVEFIFDVSAGGWIIDDNSGTSELLSESTPVGAKVYKLTIRANDMRGMVDGVEKVSIASNAKTTNTRSGIILGNFAGGAVDRMSADNFIGTGVDTSASGQPTMRRWGGVPFLGGHASTGRSW